MTFDPRVFSSIRDGSQRSAAIVVPELNRIVAPRSVLDVGGGEGWWAAEFARLGARATCVDDGTSDALVDGVEHLRHDLRRGLPARLGRFDLALCLEVLEHLDAEAGDALVAAMCRVSPCVVFSAAVPGQGGHGHVNEQWPAYWVERFDQHGFSCSGALRWMFWDDDLVEYWYRQNLLVATSDPMRYPSLFETPLAPPRAVVHPDTLARALASG